MRQRDSAFVASAIPRKRAWIFSRLEPALTLNAGENPRSFYADGAVCAPANLHLLEHGSAAGEHVAVGGIEVAGVPGIGHVAGALGPIE